MMGILVSCGNEMADIKAFAGDDNAPTEISTGVTMQLTDMGIKRYVLKSPRIEKYLTDKGELFKFPTGFELTTFDTTGVQVNYISAKKGEMHQALGEIVLRDSVYIHNLNQESLRTDLLYVFVQQDSIFTNRPVTVSSLAGEITGEFGLTSNLNFTEYEMLKVDGELETNEIYEQEPTGGSSEIR